MSQNKLYWLIIPVALLVFTACEDSSGPTAKDSFKPANENHIASIIAYNHTDDYIHELYVNGAMGPNVSAHSGGAATTCCIELPQQWRSGLQATIEWTTSPNQQTVWHKKSVPLPDYGSEEGILQIHFLPDLQVAIVVSNLFAEHPDYPGPKINNEMPGRNNTRENKP